MRIIVQKYGGTSVSTIEQIKKIARRTIETQRAGYSVVVVVSAMGKTTDQLEALVQQITPTPHQRELGMILSTGEIVSSSLLALAIQALGQKAVSLNGAQSGIATDDSYANAKITKIKPERILKHLNRGEIVVVAGYQGMTNGDITVLGRGGSDVSAVALACALNAESCHIFTDVEGVFTADPKIVSQASLLEGISYEEMIELAASGAQVMMGRAVEIARKFDLNINVRSSDNNQLTGTIITKESNLEKVVITGVSHNEKVCMIDIIGAKAGDSETAEILGAITEKKINIILMSSHRMPHNTTNLSLIIHPDDVEAIKNILKTYEQEKKICNFKINNDVAQVSIVGSGIANTYGVAYEVFHTLSSGEINILMTSTSEIKISVIVPRHQAKIAVQKLHDKFQLNNLQRKLVRKLDGKD